MLDGETGILLPAGDAAAWAAQIAAVASWTPEQRAAWCRNAAERSRSFYSWSRVADDTYALYGSATGQAVPPALPGPRC